MRQMVSGGLIALLLQDNLSRVAQCSGPPSIGLEHGLAMLTRRFVCDCITLDMNSIE